MDEKKFNSIVKNTPEGLLLYLTNPSRIELLKGLKSLFNFKGDIFQKMLKLDSKLISFFSEKTKILSDESTYRQMYINILESRNNIFAYLSREFNKIYTPSTSAPVFIPKKKKIYVIPNTDNQEQTLRFFFNNYGEEIDENWRFISDSLKSNFIPASKYIFEASETFKEKGALTYNPFLSIYDGKIYKSFTKNFKEEFGYSITQYLRQRIKIELAIHLKAYLSERKNIIDRHYAKFYEQLNDRQIDDYLKLYADDHQINYQKLLTEMKKKRRVRLNPEEEWIPSGEVVWSSQIEQVRDEEKLKEVMIREYEFYKGIKAQQKTMMRKSKVEIKEKIVRTIEDKFSFSRVLKVMDNIIFNNAQSQVLKDGVLDFQNIVILLESNSNNNIIHYIAEEGDYEIVNLDVEYLFTKGIKERLYKKETRYGSIKISTSTMPIEHIQYSRFLKHFNFIEVLFSDTAVYPIYEKYLNELKEFFDLQYKTTIRQHIFETKLSPYFKEIHPAQQNPSFNKLDGKPNLDNLYLKTINELKDGQRIAVFDVDGTIVASRSKNKHPKLFPSMRRVFKSLRREGIGIVILTNSYEWKPMELKMVGADFDMFINRKNVLKNKVDAKDEGIRYLSTKYDIVFFADNREKYIEYARSIKVPTIHVTSSDFWTKSINKLKQYY